MSKKKTFRETIVDMAEEDLRNLYWNKMSIYLKNCRSDEALLGFGEELKEMAREIQIIQDELSKRKVSNMR